MLIGNFEIGTKPYLIAEAAFNHCGDFDRAWTMIEVAKRAGCDAIKYQTYKTEAFCRPGDPLFEDFKRGELPDDVWPLLKTECARQGIEFLSTPQNRSDLNLLLAAGIAAIKVGSDDLTNLPLLKDYATTGLPMILSTGMSDMDEICSAWVAIGGHPLAFMVCTSQYPSPPEEVHLKRITTMRSAFNVPIGFSDHTPGSVAAAAAVALGAEIYETHFTLDRNLPGPDHSWCKDPKGLKDWADSIRQAHAMLGSRDVRLSDRERQQKRKYQRQAGQQLRGEA